MKTNQTRPNRTSLATGKMQPLILSGSHADREARAQTLVALFVKFLSDHVDLIVRVRQDFLDKPTTEKIMGCSTWGEYCRNVLGYSEQHIRRLIAGRNPATKIFDGSKGRTPLITENVIAPPAREECGDAVLDALVNEQNYLIYQIAVNGDKDGQLLLKAVSLEGKAIRHIWSQQDPHDGWPSLVQAIYRSSEAKKFRRYLEHRDE